MNSNFRAFWLAPVTRDILGYSLFCDRNQDAVETFSEDEICTINEAVLQKIKKKKKESQESDELSLYGVHWSVENYFHPEFVTKS